MEFLKDLFTVLCALGAIGCLSLLIYWVVVEIRERRRRRRGLYEDIQRRIVHRNTPPESEPDESVEAPGLIDRTSGEPWERL